MSRTPTLEKLLLEALDLEGEERQVFVARQEITVRDELAALLTSYSEASGYFESLAANLKLPGSDVIHSESAPLDLTGQTFGQYRIIGLLGGGGMGVVYRAEDTKLRRQAALKFLPESIGHDPSARERFLREARAASALQHPHICTVYEINESADGRIYLAMALYEGQTVCDALKEGALRPDRALEIAQAIAEGLAAAHERGITHRDIKPDNVFLTADGGVRILDFGLAKTGDSGLITRAGSTLGTAAYMSPEQARGEEVDHRTDIWSLGVVLYEMLSGRRPFQGSFPQAVIYGLLNTEPEPLSVLAPHVPLHLASVVERALNKDAADRFSSCSEMIAQLRGAGAHQAALEEARELVGSVATLQTRVDDGVLHILCVDDEPELELLMRQRFRKRIRSGEWRFEFALNGVEALDVLRRNPEIGLVLTDLNMPRMDGLTLLGELSDIDQPVRTVVVSAYGDLDRIRTAMNRGAFDFVTKPIDFRDLEITVEKAAADLRVLSGALRAQREMASVQQEREVARRIQEAIMPAALPEAEGVEVYGFSAPARDVSGTFFDAFEVGEKLAVVQGEISGRGVSSALLVAMAQTLLRSFVKQGLAPAAALEELNRVPIADGLPHLGLKAFVGLLDPGSRELTYANGGHQKPFVRSAEGQVRSLESVGEGLWSTPVDVEESTERLDPGDLLLIVSAGVTGARDISGGELAIEGLAARVRSLSDLTPKRAIRDVVRGVYDHLGDADPADDLTLLALRTI